MDGLTIHGYTIEELAGGQMVDLFFLKERVLIIL